jgi:protoheme IX farnesyltransferase
MARTANRPIPAGEIQPSSALLFGIVISLIGTLWLYVMANPVAAFWASFSVMFYVFVYSIWLKRTSPQNIVIGGIAGSTPPLVGWSASEQSLEISTDSLQSMFESVTEIGSMMPWLMFFIIFLWTPPHFWALALYKSKEYGEVGVPMMPNVKGKSRTMLEMKIYSVALMVVSLYAPIANGHLVDDDTSFHVLRWSCFLLSGWYASTVWRIDINEGLDEKGRMPSAARSFFFSLYYLAMFFLLLVSSSWNLQISFIGVIICIGIIFRLESDTKREEKA